jgi:hypothetical protein
VEDFMKSSILISSVVGALALSGFACTTGAASWGDPVDGAPERAIGSDGTPSSGAVAPESGDRPSPATLRVHLVDAPNDDVSSVVVTIAKIEASVNGEWLTVATGEHTVDLLQLQNGAFLDLGAGSLPPGHVDQLRLMLSANGEHDVLTVHGDSQRYPLFVPSGRQTGIKLVGGFDLTPCATTQLTIDFDAKRSVHKVGPARGGKWVLQPVIRIRALVTAGTCAEPNGGEAPIEDACAQVTCTETEICEDGTCREAPNF